jgi:hypothetical protein
MMTHMGNREFINWFNSKYTLLQKGSQYAFNRKIVSYTLLTGKYCLMSLDLFLLLVVKFFKE